MILILNSVKSLLISKIIIDICCFQKVHFNFTVLDLVSLKTRVFVPQNKPKNQDLFYRCNFLFHVTIHIYIKQPQNLNLSNNTDLDFCCSVLQYKSRFWGCSVL